MNDLGPAKFTTQADNGTEQICYCNRNKKDTSFNFNSFLAVRKETLVKETLAKLYFLLLE